MTSRSGQGRWERVLSARRRARIAQRPRSRTDDLFEAPPKAKTHAQPKPHTLDPIARHPSERVEYVLSLGEAAVRLGMTREQLEATINAGKVEALPTGFTRMISTREVERFLVQKAKT